MDSLRVYIQKTSLIVAHFQSVFHSTARKTHPKPGRYIKQTFVRVANLVYDENISFRPPPKIRELHRYVIKLGSFFV